MVNHKLYSLQHLIGHLVCFNLVEHHRSSRAFEVVVAELFEPDQDRRCANLGHFDLEAVTVRLDLADEIFDCIFESLKLTPNQGLGRHLYLLVRISIEVDVEKEL